MFFSTSLQHNHIRYAYMDYGSNHNSPGQLLTLVEVLEQGLDCAYSLIPRRRIVCNIFGGCMCLHQRGPIGQRVHAQIDKQCQYLKKRLDNLIYGTPHSTPLSTYQNTQLKDAVVRNVVGREQQQMEAGFNDIAALAKQFGAQRWLRLVERVRQIDKDLHDGYE